MAVGFRKKKRGLFGNPADIYGAKQAEPIGQPNPPQEAPQAKSGGFFGQGGVGRAIAGTIGDTLLQMNDMAPIYAPAVEQNRLFEREQQLREQQLRDSLQAYAQKKQIDQQYAPEDQFTVFEDNAGNRWLADKRTGRVIGDRPIWVDPNPKTYIENGMLVKVPNAFAGSAPRTVTEDEWNAAKPIGGAAQPAQRTFP